MTPLVSEPEAPERIMDIRGYVRDSPPPLVILDPKTRGGESLENPIFKKFPPAAGLKTFIFRRFRTCLNALKFVPQAENFHDLRSEYA